MKLTIPQAVAALLALARRETQWTVVAPGGERRYEPDADRATRAAFMQAIYAPGAEASIRRTGEREITVSVP